MGDAHLGSDGTDRGIADESTDVFAHDAGVAHDISDDFTVRNRHGDRADTPEEASEVRGSGDVPDY